MVRSQSAMKKPVTIFFSYQFPGFRVRNATAVKRWLLDTFKNEKKKLSRINFIFCSDKFLLDINKKYLRHNFRTDIITFEYNKKKSPVEGEIFISIERVKINSENYDTTFSNELHRVMIHGVLHLCGYKDKTVDEKSEIQKREDFFLSCRKF